jgi:hypothetical protein
MLQLLDIPAADYRQLHPCLCRFRRRRPLHIASSNKVAHCSAYAVKTLRMSYGASEAFRSRMTSYRMHVAQSGPCCCRPPFSSIHLSNVVKMEDQLGDSREREKCACFGMVGEMGYDDENVDMEAIECGLITWCHQNQPGKQDCVGNISPQSLGYVKLESEAENHE